MITHFLIYLIIINILSLILFYSDKRRAIKKEWRISENTLILTSIFGGSIGAFIGMFMFRHKTKHLKFKIGIPLITLLHLILLFLSV